MLRIIASALVLFAASSSAQSLDNDDPRVPSIASAKAKSGEWVWIPAEGTTCRDGSKTGVGVRLLPDAKAVMIYLQGGGACYDAESCAQNAKAPIAGESFPREKFDTWARTLGSQGIFNTENPLNPVARWNHIYVPYCTGDLHGGDKKDAVVPGVPGKQQFVGHRNVRNILGMVAPSFQDAEDVALVGASAGGIGVLINYPQVVDAFGGRSVAALVDSAPIIPESAIKTSCFQRKVISTFDLQLPQRCSECADPTKGGLLNLYGYLSHTYPHGRYALASADADLAGVILYNDESRACGGVGVNIFNYRSSLYVLRDKHIGHDWATFLPGGIQHTMTQSNTLFLDRKFRGVSAGEWLSRINDKKPSHIPAARLQPRR
ncbi:MAG: pectin acetylesterase-family hydrolase [Woeseiaceae bacterium]